MSKKEPLVSVIIPAYNRADTISSTIMSALNQTYKNIEVIVVDDASGDDTCGRVRQIDDPRVRCLSNEVNMGSNPSRNRGAAAASGELLAFLDAADTWDHDKVSVQVERIFRDKSDVVFCNGRIHLDGKPYGSIINENIKSYLRENRLAERLSIGNFVDTTTILMRKAFFEQIGCFDEDCRLLQDYDLMIRAVQNGTVSYVDREMITSNIRPGDSMTFDVHKSLHATVYLYCKHRDYFSKYGNKSRFLTRVLPQIFKQDNPDEAYSEYAELISEKIGSTFPEDLESIHQSIEEYLVKKLSVYMAMQKEGYTYTDGFESLVTKNDSVFLFGRGIWAKRVYRFLSECYPDTRIPAFVVSKVEHDEGKTGTDQSEVLAVDEIGSSAKDIPIILSVSKETEYEVLKLLQKNSFRNVVLLSDDDRKMLIENER